MKTTVVRYRARPATADENVRLVESTFAALHAARPDDLRYLVLRLDDDSFVHVAIDETPDASRPLLKVDAFRAFTADIETRVLEGPVNKGARIVGAYRALDGLSLPDEAAARA